MNKDELKEALDAFEHMPARMGIEAMKDCTRFCNTHARTLSEAAQAHLELLELGVSVEDIKALVEARKAATQGDWVVDGSRLFNIIVSKDNAPLFRDGLNGDALQGDKNSDFIATAANIIGGWGE